MSCIQAVIAVSTVGLFEPPYVIPGFDRAVLKLLLVFGVILITGVVVTVSSVIGVIRATRRRRRLGHSRAAVLLAAIATAIASSWLLYWTGDALYHGEWPIDG